jgi:hypothetical protein
MGAAQHGNVFRFGIWRHGLVVADDRVPNRVQRIVKRIPAEWEMLRE